MNKTTLPADAAVIEAIVKGDHGDPFSVLGMHAREPDGAIVVRAFLPHVEAVEAVDTRSGAAHALAVKHAQGFFEGVVGKQERFAYRLRLHGGGERRDIDDPYRFPPLLSDKEVALLAEGAHLRAYESLGAHPRVIEGVSGVSFAVWAPDARRVSVVGDFNGWDGRRHPMRLRHECGVWEIFLPGLGPGTLYKYEIKSRAGELMALKADPFGFYGEQPPATGSIVYDLRAYPWQDGEWMAARKRASDRDAPISIYEAHLGSWRKPDDGRRRYLTYRELAETLVAYVRDMGFSHLELMPITEHPFDGSWGYQPIGLYAPTSRFGTPDDFRFFVDACHRNGIGVIADWAAGHFPGDPHGLAYFDGTFLYEHADPRQGRHREWDTLIYNYGRPEVVNYLIANALFWGERFHIDALRVDAVASMLYLDYSRGEGDWIPNRYGGRENLEAVDFLKRLNATLYGEIEGAFTVAEESTAWPMVSRPTYVGGLGFGYKWNMGWMHDTLVYMSKDPIHRRYHHNQMTFGLLYAFTENFILPLSHDEVVHGKGALLSKMPGSRFEKLANLRAYYGFMYSMPGKKLLFMGGEFGQEREWSHDRSLDWHLLDDPSHQGVQRLIRDLNRLYKETPALHALDCEPQGFEWIDCNDSDQSVLSYLRRGTRPEDLAVVVCNFTPVPRFNYRVGVPREGYYRERVNTDAAAYGGSGLGNLGGKQAEPVAWHGRPWSLALTLPPLSAVLFAWEAAP